MKELLSYMNQEFNVCRPGDITWAHAVNDKKRLRQSLKNQSVMVIESDIRISSEGDVIAAHPPYKESDLLLSELLEEVRKSNKGLKLDFKDPEAVEPSLFMLKNLEIDQPIFLNADIVQGNNASESRFDPFEFLQQCQKEYRDGIISIGWTTNSDPRYTYTEKNIAEMIHIQDMLAQATFPVRAQLLPGSIHFLDPLVEKKGFTLTIWTNDPVTEELHEWMKKNTDPEKCFYDWKTPVHK